MDGAAVMTGEIKGVTGLARRANPFIICIHCVCHRLNLAVSHATKDISEMKTICSIISTIYSYVMQVIVNNFLLVSVFIKYMYLLFTVAQQTC